MSEQEKKKKPVEADIKTPGSGGDGFWDGPTQTNMATVSHGPYSEDVPVAGMTVGEIRKKFARRQDIDPAAESYIGGRNVDDLTIVKTGETLTFMKHAGEKGWTG